MNPHDDRYVPLSEGDLVCDPDGHLVGAGTNPQDRGAMVWPTLKQGLGQMQRDVGREIVDMRAVNFEVRPGKWNYRVEVRRRGKLEWEPIEVVEEVPEVAPERGFWEGCMG